MGWIPSQYMREGAESDSVNPCYLFESRGINRISSHSFYEWVFWFYSKDSTACICSTQEWCSLVFGDGSLFSWPFHLWSLENADSLTQSLFRPWADQSLRAEVRYDLTHLGSWATTGAVVFLHYSWFGCTLFPREIWRWCNFGLKLKGGSFSGFVGHRCCGIRKRQGSWFKTVNSAAFSKGQPALSMWSSNHTTLAWYRTLSL